MKQLIALVCWLIAATSADAQTTFNLYGQSASGACWAGAANAAGAPASLSCSNQSQGAAVQDVAACSTCWLTFDGMDDLPPMQIPRSVRFEALVRFPLGTPQQERRIDIQISFDGGAIWTNAALNLLVPGSAANCNWVGQDAGSELPIVCQNVNDLRMRVRRSNCSNAVTMYVKAVRLVVQADFDSDGDCTPDYVDGCPFNPSLVFPRTFYADADGDGYGNSNAWTQACSPPPGHVLDNSDCNDSNASIHPGAPEACNGVSDDCDGQIDEGLAFTTYYRDLDGDGYGSASFPSSSCSQPTGYVSNASDCNDGNASIHPGTVEVCNGVDDDCDASIDEVACNQASPYCFGDGTGFACPCGNSGAPGHGCANSVDGQGALLTVSGTASIANDTLVLHGAGMVSSASVSAIYLQGTEQDANGLGTPVQDGLRCVVGSVVRLGSRTNVGGASRFPDTGDPLISVRGGVTAPSTRYYQTFYRNAAAAFCPPGTANWTNGMAVFWTP